MSLPFNILIFLIAAIPIIILVGSGPATSVQMIAAAIGLISVAISARAADAQQFGRATSGVLWALLLMPLFVVLQLLPLPLSLSHPIWTSAAEALRGHPFGHVTVDVGATLSALFATLASVALIWLAVIVVRDRRRAELVLLAVFAITALTAVASIAQQMFSLASKAPDDVTRGLCGLGVIVSLATILLAIERRETRHEGARGFMALGLAGLAGAAINGTALYAAGGTSGAAGAAFGVTLFLLIVLIRRLDLSRWPTAILCVATIAGAAILMGYLFDGSPDASGLLRFLPAQSPDSVAVFVRMLGDTRWLGSGAGSFEALARIYHTGDAQSAPLAPSTAVAFAVEIGWIGLTGFMLTGLAMAAKLFSSALQRGRDSFFPAAAAACLIAALCDMFVGSWLRHASVAILLGIVTGIGLGQSFSQSARE